MKIDLKAYGKELEFWLEAFKPFVDHGSQPALPRLKQQLEDGRDIARPTFPWKLDKPIVTKAADRYDGTGKTPHRVRIGWQFAATFERGNDPKNRALWMVKEMATHIHVSLSGSGEEILHFHFDLKNKGQLGPHAHMQLSEHFLKNKNRVPVAVPRFPSTAVLPTDCLDLVLAEFFPFEWPRSQSDSRGLNTLQTGQQKRIMEMSQAIAKGWPKSRMTPISAIQDCFMPDLQIV